MALDLGGKAARYRLSDVIDALNARKDEIRQALDDDRAARKQAAKVAAKSTPSAH